MPKAHPGPQSHSLLRLQTEMNTATVLAWTTRCMQGVLDLGVLKEKLQPVWFCRS